MGMTPQNYFTLFVEENFNDFLNNPTCLRRAFNSVVSTAHMADNYFNYYEIRDASKINNCNNFTDFKIHLASQLQYFNDIQSIANVYKHLYQGHRTQNSWVTVESGGAVFITENEVRILMDGEFAGSDSLDDFALMPIQHIVYHNINTNTEIPLVDALTEVVKFWKNTV